MPAKINFTPIVLPTERERWRLTVGYNYRELCMAGPALRLGSFERWVLMECLRDLGYPLHWSDIRRDWGNHLRRTRSIANWPDDYVLSYLLDMQRRKLVVLHGLGQQQ